MNARLAAVLAGFLIFPLAGCFGIPEGTADLGEAVTLDLRILDPVTKKTLLHETGVPFIMGEPTGGLAFDLSALLAGHRTGDRVVQTSGGPVPDDSPLLERDANLPDFPAVGQDYAIDFENFLGKPPIVGETYEIPGGFFPLRVETLEQDLVGYRFLVADGQADALAGMVSTLHSQADGDVIHRKVESTVGATFFVTSTGSGEGVDLNLPPGCYRTLEGNDTTLRFAYRASGSPFAECPLVFEFTLIAVEDAELKAPEGNLGVRKSRQVLVDA